MKKTILTIATTAMFITGAVFISCNTPTENLEDAKAKIEEAKEDLSDANQEYIKDLESFRTETDKTIETNKLSIADFKSRIDLEKKEAKADYTEKIEDLEKKNTDIKKRLDDYKAAGKENWEKFKTQFTQDMENLGQAFLDLSYYNVK